MHVMILSQNHWDDSEAYKLDMAVGHAFSHLFAAMMHGRAELDKVERVYGPIQSTLVPKADSSVVFDVRRLLPGVDRTLTLSIMKLVPREGIEHDEMFVRGHYSKLQDMLALRGDCFIPSGMSGADRMGILTALASTLADQATEQELRYEYGQGVVHTLTPIEVARRLLHNGLCTSDATCLKLQYYAADPKVGDSPTLVTPLGVNNPVVASIFRDKHILF